MIWCTQECDDEKHFKCFPLLCSHYRHHNVERTPLFFWQTCLLQKYSPFQGNPFASHLPLPRALHPSFPPTHSIPPHLPIPTASSPTIASLLLISHPKQPAHLTSSPHLPLSRTRPSHPHTQGIPPSHPLRRALHHFLEPRALHPSPNQSTPPSSPSI